MPRRFALSCLAALLLAAAVSPTAAIAGDGVTGGASPPEEPQVFDVSCAGQPWTCAAGQPLTVKGDDLQAASAVVFLGRAGRWDDRRVRVRRASETELTARVPSRARSGPLRVLSTTGDRSSTTRKVRVVARAATVPEPVPTTVGYEGFVFPIAGAHDLGQSPTNNFGGDRGHKGQDMFARCGTPLVAVTDSTVLFAAFQSRAGNYVVLQRSDGESYAYMHMRDPALVEKRDVVTAGQRIGYVGDTGQATGCHLHFELWTAPGWYLGGEPVDPLPALKAWDAAQA